MKRNVFTFPLTILFVMAFLFCVRGVRAQGTFECFTQGMAPHNCISLKSNCEPGYKPVSCEIFFGTGAHGSCDGKHDCVSEEVVNDCAKKNLVNQCPAGYPVDCKRGFLCCKTQERCDLLPVPGGSICDNMPDECGSCLDKGSIWTALGCIPANNLNEFIRWALSKIVFVASGIAFLLMVFGAIQILTSAGNPEKVKAGKELITSALSGLLFIILSFFLLKLIGVDILQIPGLGK